MWTVRLASQVQAFLDDLTGPDKTRIEKALERLATNPHEGKPLKGELKGIWSLRIGNFRLLYEIQKSIVVVDVLHAAHRREVYTRFRR